MNPPRSIRPPASSGNRAITRAVAVDVDLSVPWRQAPPIQPTAAVHTDRLQAVRQGYCALVTLAALIQLLFFSGVEDNLLAVALALASSLAGIAYALDTNRVCTQPISALILLFYTTTSTSGALLVKSLERSALVDRLSLPVTTFAVLFAGQLILIVADRLYLQLQPLQAARRFITRRALQPLGLLRWPGDTQIWLLGMIGCISVALTGTDYESGATFGMASAGAKLLRAFGFLKFAPFLIPFRDALSGLPTRSRVPMLPLGAYFVLLIAISFATNSRSTFADAVPTIGICVLLALALGRLDLRRVPPSRLLMFALLAMVGSMLLSRVALAMVVVRDYRYSVDVNMLMRMTLEALTNSEWLEAAKNKMDSAVNVGNYSETYVDSRFAARFLLTKFHDNVLYYFSLMGPDHIASYRGFMFDRFAATLPDPLLRYFGLAIDKQALVISNGDYVVYLVDGWGLGGFKTGSMMGEVYAVCGWAAPLVLLLSGWMLFVFHDAFVAPGVDGRLAFSPLIILLIWNLVGTTAAFGLGAETVTVIFSGIARGLPQSILVYVIAIAIVNGIARLTGRGA